MGDDARRRKGKAPQPGPTPGAGAFVAVTLVLLCGLTLAALYWWEISEERASLLVLGASCLALSVLVGVFNVISYSRQTDFDRTGGPPQIEATEPPVPRAILVPVLVVVGLGFVIAATATGTGERLRSPASESVSFVQFALAAWDLAFNTVFLVALVWFAVEGIRRHEWTGLVVVLVLAGIVVGGNFLIYVLWPEWFHQVQDDYWAPFRFVTDHF